MTEEKIAEIVDYQFKGVNNLTPEAYKDSLRIITRQILDSLAGGELGEKEHKQFHESVYKAIRQDIVGHTATEKKVVEIEAAAKDLFNAQAIRIRAQCEKEKGEIFKLLDGCWKHDDGKNLMIEKRLYEALKKRGGV